MQIQTKLVTVLCRSCHSCLVLDLLCNTSGVPGLGTAWSSLACGSDSRVRHMAAQPVPRSACWGPGDNLVDSSVGEGG